MELGVRPTDVIRIEGESVGKLTPLRAPVAEPADVRGEYGQHLIHRHGRARPGRRLKARQCLLDQYRVRRNDRKTGIRRLCAERLREFFRRGHALLAFECQSRRVEPPVKSEIDLAAPRVEYGYE